jgi:hypothetical protein
MLDYDDIKPLDKPLKEFTHKQKNGEYNKEYGDKWRKSHPDYWKEYCLKRKKKREVI